MDARHKCYEQRACFYTCRCGMWLHCVLVSLRRTWVIHVNNLFVWKCSHPAPQCVKSPSLPLTTSGQQYAIKQWQVSSMPASTPLILTRMHVCLNGLGRNSKAWANNSIRYSYTTLWNCLHMHVSLIELTFRLFRLFTQHLLTFAW